MSRSVECGRGREMSACELGETKFALIDGLVYESGRDEVFTRMFDVRDIDIDKNVHIAITCNGKWLIFALVDSTLLAMNVETKKRHGFSLNDERATCVLAIAESLVAVGTEGGTVAVFNVETRSLVGRKKIDEGLSAVTALDFRAQTDTLFIATNRGKLLMTKISTEPEGMDETTYGVCNFNRPVSSLSSLTSNNILALLPSFKDEAGVVHRSCISIQQTEPEFDQRNIQFVRPIRAMCALKDGVRFCYVSNSGTFNVFHTKRIGDRMNVKIEIEDAVTEKLQETTKVFLSDDADRFYFCGNNFVTFMKWRDADRATPNPGADLSSPLIMVFDGWLEFELAGDFYTYVSLDGKFPMPESRGFMLTGDYACETQEEEIVITRGENAPRDLEEIRFKAETVPEAKKWGEAISAVIFNLSKPIETRAKSGVRALRQYREARGEVLDTQIVEDFLISAQPRVPGVSRRISARPLRF